MHLLLLILIFCLLLLCLWLAACRYAFEKAMGRGTGLDLTNKKAIQGTAWERYYSTISAGIDWIHSQPQETVQIISRDGITLCGAFLPHPQAIGTVILFHGYRTFAACDFSADADHYYHLGYHLLLVDQRGCNRSGGHYITFGLLERFDCCDWIAYIQQRFGATHPVFLGGLSLGASTVLMAGGESLPANVKGIIADSAFSSPKDIIGRTIKKKYHLPPAAFLPGIRLWARLLAGVSLSETSTIQAMASCKTPVLFVHGQADDYVPYEMTISAYQNCHSFKKLFVVEKADHGTAYLLEPKAYRDLLTDFFKNCMGI